MLFLECWGSVRAEEEQTDQQVLSAPGGHEWAGTVAFCPAGNTPQPVWPPSRSLLAYFGFLSLWSAQLPATVSNVLLFLFPWVTNCNLWKLLSRKGLLIKVDATGMTNVRGEPHI